MDMLAALRLQIEWGADEALDDAPVDRLSRAAPLAAPQAAAPPAPVRAGPVARAVAAAESANTLEALYRTLAAFRDCPLAATATHAAIARGNPASGLVLVGEAPGDEDDLAGRPLVGPAGLLLDRMLASIGLGADHALITNLVPWRPPGGRAPTEAEVALCAPFLWRHLTLLRPRVVVMLGQLPARVLTGSNDTIRRLRGRWRSVTVPGLPAPISALPMLHPATVMRMPATKKDAWTDLVALRRHLDANRRGD
jgi:DNA polymerase